jgi:hypothetical protein
LRADHFQRHQLATYIPTIDLFAVFFAGVRIRPFCGAGPASPAFRLVDPHNVLQVLPISLLGAVVGLVCHNAHNKQQVLPMARTKCSSKVKTKRRNFAASFWVHFEPRFEPLGWCVIVIQAPQADCFDLVAC